MTFTSVSVLKLCCVSVFVHVCVYVSMCSRVVEPSGFRVLGFVGALGDFFQ
jgi:hypothetical protein